MIINNGDGTEQFRKDIFSKTKNKKRMTFTGDFVLECAWMC